MTELIKKIGGFRVGTFPDFEAAMQADDPAAYLRKLVPYASVVCATTVSLTPPETMPDRDPAESEHKPTKRGSKKASEDEEPADTDLADAEDADATDGEDDIDAPPGGPGGGLEGLIQAVLGEEDFEDEPDPPSHAPYPLQPLIDAIAAVGFDGSLAVRYSGAEDCVTGTDLSRWALEHAVEHKSG